MESSVSVVVSVVGSSVVEIVSSGVDISVLISEVESVENVTASVVPDDFVRSSVVDSVRLD